MSDLVVEVTNLRKVFGSGNTAFEALRGVDFQARRGEVVMIAGPSGSGKTTLLSVIGCVLRPTSGSVRLLGQDISRRRESELPALRLDCIGFVFQGHNLISSLTALDNVAFPMRMRGWDAAQARREAARLLDRVGLQNKHDSIPNQLSGGQRQRVAIARAVAGNPPIILADEPTASLDASAGVVVSEMLRDLAKERGHTVVIVTHDNRIFHLADRIVHIEDGHIVRSAA
jgi:putative ABC transport system ATP-binding protein